MYPSLWVSQSSSPFNEQSFWNNSQDVNSSATTTQPESVRRCNFLMSEFLSQTFHFVLASFAFVKEVPSASTNLSAGVIIIFSRPIYSVLSDPQKNCQPTPISFKPNCQQDCQFLAEAKFTTTNNFQRCQSVKIVNTYVLKFYTYMIQIHISFKLKNDYHFKFIHQLIDRIPRVTYNAPG
jgi:hypothetical protein